MENRMWKIELTEEQLLLISRSLEFVSRFACGQIGESYLPNEIREIMFNKDNGEYDWDDINKRRAMFNSLGNLIKTTLYPELSCETNVSYGINKNDYADNLYDIYKMINHKIHLLNNIYSSPNDRKYDVNSTFLKCGSYPNINLEVIKK